MSEQHNAQLLNDLYDQGDPRVGILYKYRSCLPHNLSILDVNGIWFSRHADLNDPFDCLIRLPEKHSAIELAQLAALLRGAAPYTLAIDNGEDTMRYISSAAELGALECIGLLAGQLKHSRLLAHLKIVCPDDRERLVGLVEMATEIHRTLLTDTGISRSRKFPIIP